jgi:crossover junction endodeoxyribonuclease RuvC
VFLQISEEIHRGDLEANGTSSVIRNRATRGKVKTANQPSPDAKSVFDQQGLVADFHLEAQPANPKLDDAASGAGKFCLTMRVLAIDASLRNSGVAVIEANGAGKFQALYFGVIHNPASLAMSSCLVAIRARLADLIQAHQPDCCALESVIYVQSHKTTISLGAARGSAILAAAERGLPVFEYAPKRIKQATVGNGSADKSQVAFMVRALLRLSETPQPDAADALAIGLTHLRAQEAARLGLPGGVRI